MSSKYTYTIKLIPNINHAKDLILSENYIKYPYRMKTQNHQTGIPSKKQPYEMPKISRTEVKLEYSIAQASVDATMKESKDTDSETVDIGW